MPGIDRQRVVGKSKDELDELTCSICQDIFADPMVTQCCRQTYCKDCINQWLITNNTCPNDRKGLTADQLCPVPRLVINLLNKLTVKCENSSNDCQSVLSIEEMAKHILICDYYSCNSCKTSKILLSEKHKEIDSLRNQLKAKETNLKDMEERLHSLTITKNRCEKELIISARTNPSFQSLTEMGLNSEEKVFLLNVIRDVLSKTNSFREASNFLNISIKDHHKFKQLSWVTIVGSEYNSTYGGQVRFCIKYNNGLKVILSGYK